MQKYFAAFFEDLSKLKVASKDLDAISLIRVDEVTGLNHGNIFIPLGFIPFELLKNVLLQETPVLNIHFVEMNFRDIFAKFVGSISLSKEILLEIYSYFLSH